ncbi:unnamed protein product [Caenorhabditis sp. 36 PRJEB53466]|nr:unnamed protein product [Caenorhabditis sp. 36 PRJEB53466]
MRSSTETLQLTGHFNMLNVPIGIYPVTFDDHQQDAKSFPERLLPQRLMEKFKTVETEFENPLIMQKLKWRRPDDFYQNERNQRNGETRKPTPSECFERVALFPVEQEEEEPGEEEPQPADNAKHVFIQMDLLVFDAKKGNRRGKAWTPVALDKKDVSEMLGERKIEAFLNGGLVQILDEQVAEILYEMAGIGEWLEDGREESTSVSRTCFGAQNDVELEELSGSNWADLSPVLNILVLTPEETILLAVDWQILELKKGKMPIPREDIWLKMSHLSENPDNFGKSFAVFRFLRENGWIVRSGHTFGCDFLIYCLGAQQFHSSAGVLISDEIDPIRLLTLTRILAHNKKALVLATCGEAKTFEDSVAAKVEVVTSKTYFLERDVAQISNRKNEVYEVKTETLID